MRRHLLLVRHAKSSWDDLSLADRDRPLAPRGRSALPLMREHLAAAGHRPDLVLCSPARRTVDTLDGIRPALGDGVLVEVDPDLYGLSAGELLERLRGLDAAGCVMVVGHNPCQQEMAVSLAGAGDVETVGQLDGKFPTGAIATLSFDGSWADLGQGAATVESLFMPRKPRS